MPRSEDLEAGGVAGAVPKMKNLDDVRGLNDPIVDQDGRMDELADTEPSVDGVTDVREAS